MPSWLAGQRLVLGCGLYNIALDALFEHDSYDGRGVVHMRCGTVHSHMQVESHSCNK